MNNKFDNLIPRWMKDSERKKLADSLTSMLTPYSGDWSVHDSHKAIDAFERWVYPLIDKERFRRQTEFERDLTFSFYVTQNVQSDELFDLLQEYQPEKWHYIRDKMQRNPAVDLTYEDRYINTPLGCILLAQFIRRIRDLYLLNYCSISVTLSKKDFRVKHDDDDLKLDHRFSFIEKRDSFMKRCLDNIVKDKYYYEAKNIGHTRALCISNHYYRLSLFPDGGLAHGWGIENGRHSCLTTKDLLHHLDINVHCFNREAKRYHKLGNQYTVKFELLDGTESQF
jgi:hypothetical protein